MVKFFLDLFSGTGSVGEVAKELGYTVIGVDRDMEAEIQIDIMDWDYTVFPTGFSSRSSWRPLESAREHFATASRRDILPILASVEVA